MHLFSSCPVCGSTDLLDYCTAKDPHYGIAGEYRIVRCTSCGVQFTNPMCSGEELASLYPADYYAYGDPPTAGKWKIRAKKWIGYWQGTKEPRLEHGGNFLDIGCGAGEMLGRMRERGWDAYGVEINGTAVERGRKKGLRIFAGTIQEAQFPSEYFDFIRASHSFEHVTSPHEVLSEVRRILKPNGTVAIAVPNIDSIPARVFGRYWWHLCPPVHPFGYSVTTLSSVLRKHEFEVTKVVYNSDYVGLLGSIQIWLNRKNGKKSFDGPVFRNRLLRVLFGWMEKLCDAAKVGDMIEIHARKSEQQVHSPTLSQNSFEVDAVA